MSVFDRALAAAQERPARVVFPEMDEPRIAEAAEWLRAKKAAVPLACDGPTNAQMAVLVDGREVKEGVAWRMLSRPMFQAAAMVAAGEADAMVAGAVTATRRVIEAASIVIGMAEGVTVPSSYFLMVFPDGREMIWADCAVNVMPDAAELADIARASAASGTALLGEARVALLSFSTGTSGAGESVKLVRAVAEATGYPGPVQADAALNAAIAETKGIACGNANVLIFPDLNAGNIAYKLVQELSGAQAVGPLLQGFAGPVCDLSRGASPDDIVAATVLTVARNAGLMTSS
ncbi:MAG: phosphate acetyltransferase [Rhodobacteraceae bacterium]|nr:phosphate acetyltransferase [Paracoccaceae bacterium]